MWLCEGAKIDWGAVGAIATAVAALIALGVWTIDKLQRQNERKRSAKLLAQMMTGPVGAAQIEIARLRSDITADDHDQSYVVGLINSQEVRKDFFLKVSFVTFDLPSQYVDKADLFAENVNNRVACALSQVSRLKVLASLLAALPDSAREEDINEHAIVALRQILEAENSIGKAFQALLDVGKSAA